MGKFWLIVAISSYFLLDIVQCQKNPEIEGGPDKGNQIESEPQDVLDTGAWLGNWFLAIALYAGRQERPWRRDSRFTLDDLPNIYIPNELTGNEIVRALKLTGKEQMVVEENELHDFINFQVMQKEDFNETVTSNATPGYDYDFYDGNRYDDGREQNRYLDYLDEEDGHFVLAKDFINKTMNFLQSQPTHSESLSSHLGENVIDAIREILEETRLKKSYESWDDMVQDFDGQYQQIMSILEKKTLVKKIEDGFYTLTKSGTDLIHNALNETILKANQYYQHPGNRDRYRDYNPNYAEYKAYKDFLERIGKVIRSSATILHLPSELSWTNIKATIQTMYKKAVPRVHLYQFLTRTMDYLEIDTEVKGMSKLSPYLTQQMINGMWGIFGRGHPFRN